MSTLANQARHSLGDLTLHILNFSDLGSSDSYNLTNSAGIVGIWGTPWAGTGSGGIDLKFTNSSTGGTITSIATAATTCSVYVLSHG